MKLFGGYISRSLYKNHISHYTKVYNATRYINIDGIGLSWVGYNWIELNVVELSWVGLGWLDLLISKIEFLLVQHGESVLAWKVIS